MKRRRALDGERGCVDGTSIQAPHAAAGLGKKGSGAVWVRFLPAQYGIRRREVRHRRSELPLKAGKML